jgi:PAS domain S-box-containing protein
LPRRQIALVALILGVAVAGFAGAHAVGAQEARRNAERRAEVAAAQIRGRVAQASDVTESLRIFMATVGGLGVTSAQFQSNSSTWLSPAGFPAAAWVQQIPASQRAGYERRVGHPIVTQDAQGQIVPVGPRPAYLPATLVSGVAPMTVSGMDLGSERGVTRALARASKLYDAGATPLANGPDGTTGLLLIRFAPRLTQGVVEPGFVVVFVSALTLRDAATGTPVRITVGGTPTGARLGRAALRATFAEGGEQFAVEVPLAPLSGAATVLPWIILAAGLALAALASALGIHAAQRTRAQDELDRIFTLTPDLIAVSDFKGRFTRVNPAVEQVLGYTPEEFLVRPYLELVHPDDRDRTAAEAAALSEGKTTLSFENRFIGKDGSPRVLEWTAIPVLEDRLTYGVARDVTARRRAESELRRLAEEQTALRRVATLVARESTADEVFAKVAEEVGLLLEADAAAVWRYETGEAATVVGKWGELADTPTLGRRWKLEGGSVTASVYRTNRPARFDGYASTASGSVASLAQSVGLSSAVGTPIFVGRRLWGSIAVANSRAKPLPADAEARMAKFTELVATAISNVQARLEVRRLAAEQAALRRVATMIARESPAEEVFAKVAEEVIRLLGADAATVWRYEPDGDATVVGSSGKAFPVGSRWKLDGDNVTALVHGTRRPARFDDYEHATNPIGVATRELGLRSAVGTPIIVSGRLWGAVVAATFRTEPMPADAEPRIAEFTELVATAISNVQARSDLAASRARIVAATDDERRRVVRDLHDGAQQRLVHTVVTLKLALRSIDQDRRDAADLVGEALQHAQTATEELRDLAHGILPSILTDGGLGPGVRALGSRMTIPVEFDVSVDRLPKVIEATAYFIVAETLTNVAKHSQANRATVRAWRNGHALQIEVRDDGIGGAQANGPGLLGLTDRLAALGGRMWVESPPGGGTLITASIPIS